MANIRIEKKSSPSILPWIIGLLVLGLLVWGVAEMFEEADEVAIYEDADYVEEPVVGVANNPLDVDDTEVVVTDNAYRNAIAAFVDYTADMEGKMGLDHEFSHRALSLLAAATAQTANAYDVENVNAEGKANQVIRLADDITVDPYATNHADKIRMAALLITEVLEDLDSQVYNDVNADALSNLRREAQDINAKTLTLNQKEDVRSFFSVARNILMKMS